MPKKPTKAKAEQASGQNDAVQPGMSLDEVREAMQQTLEELEQKRIETLDMLEQEGAEQRAQLQVNWGEIQALIENQRGRFMQEVDSALEEVGRSVSLIQAAGAPPEKGASVADPGQEHPGDCDLAMAAAEQAVAVSIPLEMEPEVPLEPLAPEMAEPTTGIVGLDGEDPVYQAQAVIEECLESVMSAGGSHVENVFRQMHGIGVQEQDNG